MGKLSKIAANLSMASLVVGCALCAAPAMAADAPVQMPSQAQMRAALQAFVDATAKMDADKIAVLWAPDAIVEDPIGSPLKKGPDAVAWARSVATRKIVYELDSPIRVSATNEAAMAITAHVGQRTLKVIETFTFNKDGKIATMRAIWGSDDFSK